MFTQTRIFYYKLTWNIMYGECVQPSKDDMAASQKLLLHTTKSFSLPPYATLLLSYGAVVGKDKLGLDFELAIA